MRGIALRAGHPTPRCPSAGSVGSVCGAGAPVLKPLLGSLADVEWHALSVLVVDVQRQEHPSPLTGEDQAVVGLDAYRADLPQLAHHPPGRGQTLMLYLDHCCGDGGVVDVGEAIQEIPDRSLRGCCPVPTPPQLRRLLHGLKTIPHEVFASRLWYTM